MGSEFRDLRGMIKEVFYDEAQYTSDPSYYLNFQPQSVVPSYFSNHPSISYSTTWPVNSAIHGEFGYDQQLLDLQSSLNVDDELRNQQQLISENNTMVDLSSMSSGLTPSTSSIANSDSPDDSEGFSDIVLSYINQILMDEELDDKFDQYPEHPALLAAEKPFYDILGEKFPPSPDHPPLSSESSINCLDSIDRTDLQPISNCWGDCWPYTADECQLLQKKSCVVSFAPPMVEGVDATIPASDIFVQAPPASNRRMAQKFIPSNEKEVSRETESMEAGRHSALGSNVRKNRHGDELDQLEGRSSKQSAISANESSYNEFDDILLSDGVLGAHERRGKLQTEANKGSQSNGKGSGGGRGRGKRQPKKEIVDLATMLTHCAQSVSTGDSLNATELLKQIRQHSSPYGDANQRLAHYFADGLEARLAGTGSQVYRDICLKGISSTTDILKAYRLYTAACPFKKVSYFFSDQTILNVAKNATRLHIVDFGVYHGLQWPCFMQQLSRRPGGPPKLRMTGIDLPLPGFRPTELIEETGRRLADYARKFDVPFEFCPIATKWESVRVEDLDIREDEVLVVNCLYRFKNLLDESVVEDSPRNVVLNLIRNLKPDVFINGIVNGSYGVPFFITRFREALFYFSSLFDTVEATATKEDESRLLLERILFGREALNVIACEGSDRNERPESYRQWQARYINAGFTQLSLDRDIVKKVKHRVKARYNKDFVVDEDSQWLLQGWKGRILYALSTWKPGDSS